MQRIFRQPSRVFIVMVAVAAAMVIAAFVSSSNSKASTGSSSSSSSTTSASSTSGPIATTSSSGTTNPSTLGTTGAATANAPITPGVKARHFTIAYGEPAAVDEVTNRNVIAVHWAAQQLGWTLDYFNAQGSVTALSQWLLTEVDKHVNGIIIGSTGANLVRPALLAAKQAGIPVIAIGGGVPQSSLYAANATENEPLMSKQLTQYMVKSLGGSGDIAAINISELSSGVERQQARDAVLKGTKIKVVTQADGDLSNPIKGTQNLAADMLTRYPHIKAFWLVYDYMLVPTVTALKEAGLEGKVKLYSWFAGPANAALLHNHSGVEALVEDDLDHTGLVAMDDLAGHLVSHKPIDPNPLQQNPLKYEVVTLKNAPPLGHLVWPIANDEATFAAKWAKGKFGTS